MQKWEYCEIEVVIGGPLSGTKAEVTYFKKDRDVEQTGKLGPLLAELGEEGWELVAASARTETGLGGKHKINYILKRPMEDVSEAQDD
jgi:hypothetical protein